MSVQYNCVLKRKTWENGTDYCKWHGVACNTISGHVIGLDVTFPPQSFGDIPSIISHLSKLRSLHLFGDQSMMRVDPCTWNKLIQNATNLKELHLIGVDMSFIGDNSLSLLTNLSSSLIDLILIDTKLQANLSSDILSLPNLKQILLHDNEKLRGELPKSNWSAPLVVLGLDNTAFSGNIPDSIGHLKSLYMLALRNCSFDEVVPSSLFNLTQLLLLDLSHNNLTGLISEFSSYSLEFLFLDHNNLSGRLDFYQFSKFKNLNLLDLSFNKLQGDLSIVPNGIEYFLVSNNELTGNIPSTMCNASSLIILDLAHNNLTGPIPPNFCKGNALKTLKLNGNQLDGLLPRSLAHCTNLKVLDLTGNNIEDTFPHWLESLQELQVLSLRSNKFHGVITCFGAKHPFPRQKIFDVSNNNFSGPLPASYIKNFQGMVSVNDNHTGFKYKGNQNLYCDSVELVMKGCSRELVNIFFAFTTIDLSNNMFEGGIPIVIGELHSLIGLNLSHNAITGTIPGSFGNLKNLEWLDLSWNRLKGEIPVALINLNFLAVLNLSCWEQRSRGKKREVKGGGKKMIADKRGRNTPYFE
uniref:Disease resistance R13L4/SHOC-2-like LRR domain-containing protein n=1 Tax=Glycine max TaxID=3847 RepID=A0A0R0G957_SOYBN